MGLFHCPMGAPFWGDDACIDCGLCSATSSEERVAASKKLRDYIRSHAVDKGAIKKIAVAGKGGTGKSSVVTLMANALREEGYTVLVLDTDESNPGLYRMFGFDKGPQGIAAGRLARLRQAPRRQVAQNETYRQERTIIPGLGLWFLLFFPVVFNR